MNKFLVICGVLSWFTIHFIPTTNAYAGENDEIKAPNRIPSPPPPPPAPCPPIPPGVEMEQTCETPTLDELRAKYLETEGPNNRGLNFYTMLVRILVIINFIKQLHLTKLTTLLTHKQCSKH